MHRILFIAVLGVCAYIAPSVWAMEEGTPVSVVPETSGAEQTDEDPEVWRENMETGDLLYRVLLQTYENNPTLQAARMELGAVREALPQARSGFFPTVSADADVLYVDTEEEGGASGESDDGGNTSAEAGVNLSQPLYRGGRTVSSIRAANHTIAAQEAILHGLVQQILLDAATAYMDVRRDAALVRLGENNRDVIARELDSTRERFRVGELTRTDISQAEARLAEAEAELVNARGALRSSRAVYVRLAGVPPETTMPYPDARLPLPEGAEDVAVLAEQASPDVLRAMYESAAAEEDIDTVFGELLPEVSLTGGLSQAYDPQPGILDERRQASVGISASIPLYQSGAVRSRVRAARQTASQRTVQVIEKRRMVRQEAISNWEDLKAAEAEIRSREAHSMPSGYWRGS